MKGKLAILAAAMLTISPAHAERDYSLSNFNYDSLSVHIGVSDKQLTANGTKTIHPNAHLSLDISTDTEDKYSTAAGLNFHAPITDWADLHGGIKALYLKDDSHKDSTGWAFELGYRQWFSPQLELFGNVQWDYLDDSSLGARVGILFHATSNFSIGSTYGINEISGNTILLTTKYEY